MDKICEKISSLPTNSSKDFVCNSLQPLIHEELEILNQHVTEVNEDDANCAEVFVSPLMVACDKSQGACLEYFVDLLEEESEGGKKLVLLERLIGRPLDTSPDHRNQAAHFAVMSQSPEMVLHLATIHGIYNDLIRNRGKGCKISTGKRLSFQSLITVLSSPNSHGDTACMMASFLGKSQMLEMWFGELFSLAKDEGIPSKQCFAEMRTMLRRKSEGGDCCLSLASGHGHADVVSCLIEEREHWGEKITDCTSEGLVLVAHGDIVRAKGVMDKIQAMSSLIRNKEQMEGRIHEFQAKIQSTRRCLIMMQVSIAQLAEKRSAELLKSEYREPDKLNKKKRERKRKKALSKGSTIEPTASNEKSPSAPSTDNDDMPTQSSSIDTTLPSLSSETLSTPIFKTLNDGTIVSSSTEKRTRNQTIQETHYSNEKEIQSMLRDRCVQSTNVTNESSRAKSEAVMESLCLDASMLLLSPHGMAMELSPSQLDVIEDVLHQQLGAVAEARQIHQRLMTQMKADREIIK